MIRMGVDEIAEAVDGTILTGKEPVDISDLQIRFVSSDSREKTQNGLFVALRGQRVDGHDFLEAAQRNGYALALVDHFVEDVPLLQIEVKDTLVALGLLARHNIDRRRALPAAFEVIGITGSVGKTTTKDITKAILSAQATTVAPVGSFNNSLGLPLTALKVDESTRYFIAEMGANHLGEIRDLTAIVPPDVSVVLKVGTAHLGEFGSVENIFKAKSEIVTALTESGTAILNSDDPYVSRMAGLTQASVSWFGLDEHARELAVSARALETDNLDRPSFTLVLEGKEAGRVRLGLSGQHNVMNALAAISIALKLGIRAEAIIKTLNGSLALSPHRMAISTVKGTAAGGSTFTLIDDSFNANPDSMKSGIEGLLRTHPQAFHVAVLGPMLELGKDSVELHSSVGAYAIEQGVEALISVGLANESGQSELTLLAQALSDGAHHESLERAQTHSDSHEALIETVNSLDDAAKLVAQLASSHPDTVVLLKGSHASGLSGLVQLWTKESAPGGSEPATQATVTATDGE